MWHTESDVRNEAANRARCLPIVHGKEAGSLVNADGSYIHHFSDLVHGNKGNKVIVLLLCKCEQRHGSSLLVVWRVSSKDLFGLGEVLGSPFELGLEIVLGGMAMLQRPDVRVHKEQLGWKRTWARAVDRATAVVCRYRIYYRKTNSVHAYHRKLKRDLRKPVEWYPSQILLLTIPDQAWLI